MIYRPTPYQQEMIDWMAGRQVSALFASPGLGKTACVLTHIDRLLLDGSPGVLFVAPLRVGLITIPNEVRKWDQFRWMRIAHLRTPEGRRAWEEGSADIYIVNNEQLPKIVRMLIKGRKTLPVDTLVWDELSTAKNPNSRRVNSLRPFLDKFPNRIGMTGTPVPNTYLDLFAQIRLLDDGKRLGRSVTLFRSTWFDSDYMGYKYTIKPGAKEIIDAKIADLAIVLRSEDHLDVPTVSTQDTMITLPPEARSAYDTLEKEFLLEMDKSNIVAPSAAALATKLLQITGGAVYGEERVVNHVHDAKINALVKLRKAHGDEPMLVLSGFRHEAERILAALPCARRFHEDDMDKWRAGEIRTWVAHHASLSHGIDGIQDSCRVAVWVTPTWSNESYIQTNARLIRTGQTRETVIHRLIASDTIDEAVIEALRTKSDTQSGLLNAVRALQLLRGRNIPAPGESTAP